MMQTPSCTTEFHVCAFAHHFTGQERDSDTKNDYFQARYYGSKFGRFLSPDPSGLAYASAGNPQSFNLFSYVRNNPLNFTDPSGMYCDYSDHNDAASASDDSQQDYHSTQSFCEGDGGVWVDDAYTHNGIDDAGRPENAVSTTSTATLDNSVTLDIPMAVWNWAALQTTKPSGAWTYGNYSGPGGSGAPIDNADAAAMVHDYCYHENGLTANSNFGAHNAALQACNQALCDTASNVHADLLAKQPNVHGGQKGTQYADMAMDEAAGDMVAYFTLIPLNGNSCNVNGK